MDNIAVHKPLELRLFVVFVQLEHSFENKMSQKQQGKYEKRAPSALQAPSILWGMPPPHLIAGPGMHQSGTDGSRWALSTFTYIWYPSVEYKIYFCFFFISKMI